jgi:hypothetical protein
MMTKHEAEAIDARILGYSDDFYRQVAPLVIEMKDREGYAALGYDSFNDYCRSLDERRLGHTMQTKRLLDRAEVEANLGIELPATHAWVLARLPSAEAQQQVFDFVKRDFPKPIERNYETYVDRWFRDNDKSTRASRTRGEDGWSREDLEADPDMARALDRIESVYGHKDRKAIQEGTTGHSRKDIIALAAFHESRMKAIHYLVIGNHWDVAKAFKFVNSIPTSQTKMAEIHNHVLAAPGLYYTWSVNGVDYTGRACHALATKVKG